MHFTLRSKARDLNNNIVDVCEPEQVLCRVTFLMFEIIGSRKKKKKSVNFHTLVWQDHLPTGRISSV
jgi:hypothetical protein